MPARAGRVPLVAVLALPLIAAAGGAAAGYAEHQRQCPHHSNGLQFLTTEQFNRQYYAACFGR